MTFDNLAKGRRRQNGRLHFWPIDPFDRKESEIILRVEPCTLEALEGQIRPSSPTRGKRGALVYNLQSMRSRWPEGRICPSRASSVHGSTRRIISDSFLSKGSIGQKCSLPF